MAASANWLLRLLGLGIQLGAGIVGGLSLSDWFPPID